jgi:anti-sigma regulatory factor (Ser/Thr protein kinase)
VTAMVLLGLLRVRPSDDEVRTVRRWLYGLLADGHAAVADDAVVGACELVTNSIKHSDTRVRGGEISIAALSVDDTRLRIEVVDAGSTDSRPTLRKVAGDALSGRGLQIVADISGGQWGARADDAGQLVWFEVPAPSPATSGRYDAQTEVRSLVSPDASYRRAGKAAPAFPAQVALSEYGDWRRRSTIKDADSSSSATDPTDRYRSARP